MEFHSLVHSRTTSPLRFANARCSAEKILAILGVVNPRRLPFTIGDEIRTDNAVLIPGEHAHAMGKLSIQRHAKPAYTHSAHQTQHLLLTTRFGMQGNVRRIRRNTETGLFIILKLSLRQKAETKLLYRCLPRLPRLERHIYGPSLFDRDVQGNRPRFERGKSAPLDALQQNVVVDSPGRDFQVKSLRLFRQIGHIGLNTQRDIRRIPKIRRLGGSHVEQDPVASPATATARRSASGSFPKSNAAAASSVIRLPGAAKWSRPQANRTVLYQIRETAVHGDDH